MCIIWLGKAALIFLFIATKGMLIGVLPSYEWSYHTFPNNPMVPDTKTSEKDAVIKIRLDGACSKVYDSEFDKEFEKLYPVRWKETEEDSNKTHDLCKVWNDEKNIEHVNGFGAWACVLIIIAILILTFNTIWTIISFCACCCDHGFLKVLPVTCTISFIFLLSGIIVFGVNADNNPIFKTKINTSGVFGFSNNIITTNITDVTIPPSTEFKTVGYSGLAVWVCCVALVLNFICIFLSALVSFLRNFCCV